MYNNSTNSAPCETNSEGTQLPVEKPNSTDWKGIVAQFVFSFLLIAMGGFVSWGVLAKLNPETPILFIIFCSLALFFGEVAAWAFFFRVELSNKTKKILAEYESKLLGTAQELQTLSQNMNANETQCKTNISLISKTCEEIALTAKLSAHILKTDKVEEMERNALKDTDIIVYTSRFTLETDEKTMLPIIVDNIRKGVIYRYLIPENGDDVALYDQAVVMWQKEFKKILHDKKYCEEQANKVKADAFFVKYGELVTKCLNLHKMKDDNPKKTSTTAQISNELKTYFCSKVTAHKILKAYSFVTVIMYAKEKIGIKYEIIIKLPTSSLGEPFTAFKVPESDDDADKKNLITQLRGLCGLNAPGEAGDEYNVFTEKEGLFVW